MKSLKQAYDDGWQALVRVEKQEYNPDILGTKIFPCGSTYIHRKEFKLTNADGFDLVGTILIPQSMLESASIPCVLYLHAHGGCRLDGLFLKQYILPKAAICLFDFAGSGLSGGEYISLGPKEARDTKQVVDHLREHFKIGPLMIWGRSMGGVAAILFAHQNPAEVIGLVLDSPFSELGKSVKDFVTAHRKVPRCLIGCLLHCLAKTAKRKTGTDLTKIRPLDVIDKINVPCFFIVGKEDILAKPFRVMELYEKCGSQEKSFFLIEGEHSSNRDALAMRKAASFIFRQFTYHTYKLGLVKREAAEDTNNQRVSTLAEEEISDVTAVHDLNNANKHLFAMAIKAKLTDISQFNTPPKRRKSIDIGTDIHMYHNPDSPQLKYMSNGGKPLFKSDYDHRLHMSSLPEKDRFLINIQESPQFGMRTIKPLFTDNLPTTNKN